MTDGHHNYLTETTNIPVVNFVKRYRQAGEAILRLLLSAKRTLIMTTRTPSPSCQLVQAFRDFGTLKESVSWIMQSFNFSFRKSREITIFVMAVGYGLPILRLLVFKSGDGLRPMRRNMGHQNNLYLLG